MDEYSQDVAEAENLVARATDEQLTGPEWALNMEICDCANAHHEVCDDIVRFLQRRLQSGSPRVALLALVLTETVVKNGPPAIHAQVGSQKIGQLRDLHSRGRTGEQLEDVLDFLRQCQPRMNTLIEGGIMGKIDERTLEECLNVNDNLMKALEESKVKTDDMMRFDSPPRAGNRAVGLSAGISQLNLQEDGNASGSPRRVLSPRSTLTTMDDDFDNFLTRTAK
ncbi:hypothetical protein BBJ29_001838 [Phytophthora kernoviae]|uniref:VHS domain-containing protein n=1 Tax=Phytophthora kernoviae TaxID=325452 RepID=A0A3F2RR41_9STRA|nr:hypothetical protein BBJ29_001838 [Phytophthora kernoviae]RLN62616.1 hypothetical protein BBP00_00004646 [Phytophthora kernoviae]